MNDGSARSWTPLMLLNEPAPSTKWFAAFSFNFLVDDPKNIKALYRKATAVLELISSGTRIGALSEIHSDLGRLLSLAPDLHGA
eukprot:12901608-Prorocentrum_lima.AAC.1